MGRPIPVPIHHLFDAKQSVVQALRSFLIWMGLFFALLMIAAAFGSMEMKLLARVAPRMAAYAAGVAGLFTFALVALPLLAWPWARRGFGRRLDARIAQMSEAELDQQIELCRQELETAASASRRTELTAWSFWLQAKRAMRAAVGDPQRQMRLTLLPSKRKLMTSAACGSIPLVAGFWIILLAILGGDGGTGLEGFTGPNTFWTKGVIGTLLVLGSAIPLLEAFTVRVDLTDTELRKRTLGRTLWSVPRQGVHLVMDDGGACQVLEANSQKKIGELNPLHFEDGQLLTLIGQLRPIH